MSVHSNRTIDGDILRKNIYTYNIEYTMDSAPRGLEERGTVIVCVFCLFCECSFCVPFLQYLYFCLLVDHGVIFEIDYFHL